MLKDLFIALAFRSIESVSHKQSETQHIDGRNLQEICRVTQRKGNLFRLYVRYNRCSSLFDIHERSTFSFSSHTLQL